MATKTTTTATALRLLAHHGLTDWAFGYDNAVNRFGQTTYRTRKITVSQKTLAARTNAEVEQTLLHEVAHALVGPGYGHGQVWLRTARRIGYHGSRCSSSTPEVRDAVAQMAKWIGTCADCPVQVPRHRKPSTKKMIHTVCQHKPGHGVITWAAAR